MTDVEKRMAEMEWRADCLKSRADALERRADAGGPCWAGYEQRGTKERDGRAVPNCVKDDAAFTWDKPPDKSDAEARIKFFMKKFGISRISGQSEERMEAKMREVSELSGVPYNKVRTLVRYGNVF